MLGGQGMSAIILAGGQSSRMGYNKALLPYKGETMLEHIVKQVSPLFEEVLVVADNRLTVDHLLLEEVRICEDAIRKSGPLAGIYSGLIHCSYNAGMVFSCDMPLVDITCISMLRHKFFNDDGRDIYCYQTADGFQPFPGIYRRESKVLIRTLLDYGGNSMRHLFDVMDTCFIEPFAGCRDSFQNLNRPEDYWELVGKVEAKSK